MATALYHKQSTHSYISSKPSHLGFCIQKHTVLNEAALKLFIQLKAHTQSFIKTRAMEGQKQEYTTVTTYLSEK